ncbi:MULTISPECIES: ATP-binding protein [Mesorhizobium]|uniref:AlbA family DNA-binding domain-containing protein n=1 Tax=Mesorhizobium TaxID=68287 RepID=UPI000801A4EC|nr:MULTISPECIES: ATP-binding protein [Mesorhizobium]PBB52315.1 ATP-binding protein [Mesorhizobium loti]QIA25385.1 ATP-binding protein [Mesorhizobium sp. AA22]
MAYFRPRTNHDILEMKERGDAEGAALEYKSSRLFEQKNEKVFETLSKELTGFANAIGGVLIIGIEEDSERRISDIRPIQDPSRNETWLEDGLLSRISPSLQISIERIDVESGHLLVLDVPPSRNAPHQAADKRFYARRLFRIDPLLPFEVEDIRRRVSSLSSGASLSSPSKAERSPSRSRTKDSDIFSMFRSRLRASKTRVSHSNGRRAWTDLIPSLSGSFIPVRRETS